MRTERPVGPPHVVASVLEADAEPSREGLARAPEGCSLVELRADHLHRDEIASLVARSDRPMIVTIRRRQDGGGFTGSSDERRAGLLAALESGARYIDVEWDSDLADLVERNELRSRLVLSHHGGSCRIDRLVDLVARMSHRGVAALKVVPDAGAIDEVLAIRTLLSRRRDEGEPPLAAFALGRAGTLSRLLASSWGSWATYGAACRDRPTAAGQLAARDLVELYDVLGISGATRLFGLIGADLSASPSAAMHNTAYRSLGLDARYLPIETDEIEPLRRLLARPGGLDFEAIGVTIPHKETMAGYCRPGDDLVGRCQAVNTVRIQLDGWTGFNTDGPAALELIRRHTDPRGRRVAILGAGGTARSIAAVLVAAGAEVTLFNRTLRRAVAAARELGARAARLADLLADEWEILVQATPRGADGLRFVDPDRLRGRVVLDAVYSATPTALVRDASARGLATEDGLALLVDQAVAQFRLMTGRTIGREPMRAAAVQWLSRAIS